MSTKTQRSKKKPTNQSSSLSASLIATPDPNATSNDGKSDKNEESRNFGHIPCKFYLQGRCQSGPACPYSHDDPENTILCKYYMSGRCKYGQNCLLSHDLDAPSSKAQQQQQRLAKAAAMAQMENIQPSKPIQKPVSPVNNGAPRHSPPERLTSPNPPLVPFTISPKFERSEPMELRRKEQHDDVAGSPASLLPASLSDLLTPSEQLELSRSQEERRAILSQFSSMNLSSIVPIDTLNYEPHRVAVAKKLKAQVLSQSYAPGRIVDDPLRLYGRSVPDDIISSPGSRLPQLVSLDDSIHRPTAVFPRPVGPNGVVRTSSPLVGVDRSRTLSSIDQFGSLPRVKSGSAIDQFGSLHRVKSGVSLSSVSPRSLYPDQSAQDDLFVLELDGGNLSRTGSGVNINQLPPASAMSYSRAVASNISMTTRPLGPTQSQIVDPRRREQLCPFAMAGTCHYGDGKCKYLHGLECPSCHLYVVHPFGTNEERLLHIIECEQRMAEKAALESKVEGKECGICMEEVLKKKDPRFGILNCEHTFCLSCIRRWRTQEQDESKSCPLCRVFTAFVTPSTIWPQTLAEKQKIIEAYKLQMSTIPCKHFKFGEAQCPFSSSCFYGHFYKDGTKEVIKLRHVQDADGTAEGKVKILGATKLSDFLFPE